MITRLVGVAEINRPPPNNHNAPILFYNDIDKYNENLLLEDTLKVKKEKLDTKNLAEDCKKNLIQKKQIVFPIKTRDHLAKYVVWNEDYPLNYVYNAELIIVTVINYEVVNPEFLFHLLISQDVRTLINRQAEKLTPNRITNAMLENLEVDIPELDIQEKILKELKDVNIKKLEIENKFKKYIKT